MSQPILFSGTKNASSWAMRAWLALRAAELSFREEIVDIRRPQRFANLARIGTFSPPAMVPVLVVGEHVIFDSLAIMEFANDVANGRLLPHDPILRAQARSLVAWQHSGLSQICARISFESAFYPYKRALNANEAAECVRLFDHLEHTLQRSRGDYLFGAVSLADFALTPAVVRLTRHDVNLGAWPMVNAWTKRLLANELVREWMADADAQPHIWLDDYLDPDGGGVRHK
jgi:glutathione S-transferase